MTLSLWPDEERKEKLPEHKAAAQRILDVVEKEIEGLEKRFKGEKCRLKIVIPFTFIKIRLREILNDGSLWSAARIGLAEAEWVKRTQSEACKQHLRAQKSDFMKEYFNIPYKEEGEPVSLAKERVFKKSAQLGPIEAMFVDYELAADKMRRFENAAMAGKESSKVMFDVLKDLPTVRSTIQEEHVFKQSIPVDKLQK